MAEIIPTIVPSSFADLENKALKLGAFAPALHIDVTDGVFAPNVTWLPSGEQLPHADRVFYEAHLMVAEPKEAGSAFAHAGAKRIVAHVESYANAEQAFELFKAWRAAGIQEIGIAALFQTPLAALEPYLSHCDGVYVMTIGRVGEQGIPFEERAVERVRELHAAHPEVRVAVDGGVSEANIEKLARAGASRFCIGTALARTADPAAVYKQLLAAAGGV